VVEFKFHKAEASPIIVSPAEIAPRSADKRLPLPLLVEIGLDSGGRAFTGRAAGFSMAECETKRFSVVPGT
jgi:hypothetical protein